MADLMQQARELLAVEYERDGLPEQAKAIRASSEIAVPARVLRAIADALRAAPAWQPIETAPRDGTRILLWDAERAEAVFGRWLDDGTGDFAPMTHWAPAVAGPRAAVAQEANNG